MNRKGSALDLIFIAVTLITFAILVVIGFKVVDEINTKFQTEGVISEFDTGNHARSASATMRGHFPGVIDNSFLFLTIGMGIVAFVLAAMVRIHPIFFVFYIIVLTIIIFTSAAFSNIYQEIAANPSFSAIASEMLFMNTIMNVLPFVIGIFGTILAIVMYKTYQGALEV